MIFIEWKLEEHSAILMVARFFNVLLEQLPSDKDYSLITTHFHFTLRKATRRRQLLVVGDTTEWQSSTTMVYRRLHFHSRPVPSARSLVVV